MPLKRLLSVYIIALLASSCATLSKNTVDVILYISSPKTGTFEGSDRKGNRRSILFTETDNFMCFEPKDAEEILK
jgi:hypothetical protein